MHNKVYRKLFRELNLSNINNNFFFSLLHLHSAHQKIETTATDLNKMRNRKK